MLLALTLVRAAMAFCLSLLVTDMLTTRSSISFFTPLPAAEPPPPLVTTGAGLALDYDSGALGDYYRDLPLFSVNWTAEFLSLSYGLGPVVGRRAVRDVAEPPKAVFPQSQPQNHAAPALKAVLDLAPPVNSTDEPSLHESGLQAEIPQVDLAYHQPGIYNPNKTLSTIFSPSIPHVNVNLAHFILPVVQSAGKLADNLRSAIYVCMVFLALEIVTSTAKSIASKAILFVAFPRQRIAEALEESASPHQQIGTEATQEPLQPAQKPIEPPSPPQSLQKPIELPILAGPTEPNIIRDALPQSQTICVECVINPYETRINQLIANFNVDETCTGSLLSKSHQSWPSLDSSYSGELGLAFGSTSSISVSTLSGPAVSLYAPTSMPVTLPVPQAVPQAVSVPASVHEYESNNSDPGYESRVDDLIANLNLNFGESLCDYTSFAAPIHGHGHGHGPSYSFSGGSVDFTLGLGFALGSAPNSCIFETQARTILDLDSKDDSVQLGNDEQEEANNDLDLDVYFDASSTLAAETETLETHWADPSNENGFVLYGLGLGDGSVDVSILDAHADMSFEEVVHSNFFSDWSSCGIPAFTDPNLPFVSRECGHGTSLERLSECAAEYLCNLITDENLSMANGLCDITFESDVYASPPFIQDRSGASGAYSDKPITPPAFVSRFRPVKKRRIGFCPEERVKLNLFCYPHSPSSEFSAPTSPTASETDYAYSDSDDEYHPQMDTVKIRDMDDCEWTQGLRRYREEEYPFTVLTWPAYCRVRVEYDDSQPPFTGDVPPRFSATRNLNSESESGLEAADIPFTFSTNVRLPVDQGGWEY